MAETQLDLLIEVYKEAQLRLIKIITGNSGAGTKTYYNTVLTQLEKLMKQLSAESGKYINTAVPAEYQKALNDTYDYFRRNNLRMNRPDLFAQIHSDAVSELAREMQYHINQGISQAGRRVMRYLDESRDNALRQQGLRASAVKIASGQTVRDMQKDLVQRLSQEGFFTVQYGSGKKAYQVGLDAYVAMVARSTTREAGNLAREKQLIDNGYDLMIMTEHYPTCGLCATLQGRVYSISGKDKRFPPLSRAFQSGYRNVHPNCRHVMTYWVESMQSPEELREALRKSNAPFTDRRSADEKALYSQQQADNRRMRADRSQFERYRARLGSEAPNTFTQFRKLKKQGGEKWDDLQKLYRSKFPKTVDNSGESGIIKVIRKSVEIPQNCKYLLKADTNFKDKDISFDILQTINDTIEEKYSEKSDFIFDEIKIAKFADTDKSIFITNYEVGTHSKTQLYLNKRFLLNVSEESVNDRCLEHYNSNWWKSKSLKDLVIHEIMHAKINYHNSFEKAERMYQTLREDLRVKGFCRLVDAHPDEFMNEMYVALNNGEHIEQKYMDVYNEYLTEFLGG